MAAASLKLDRAQWACWGAPDPSAPRAASDFDIPLMLTSARPPTRAWEVARTVVAPPLSVVKCLWEVFVWGSCRARVCAGVGGVLSVGVCACDLLIVVHEVLPARGLARSLRTVRAT